MASLLRRCLEWREERLAAREDAEKTREPFTWGLECLELGSDGAAPHRVLEHYVGYALADSARFYAAEPTSDYALHDGRLTFPSAICTESRENDLVTGHVYEPGSRRCAVLVLPYWNADGAALDPLCRLLRRCGIATLRLSLPYHDARRPAGDGSASGMVSANIGRTIRSNRQAVLDARRALDWLQGRGYRRLGLLGMSLGSSVGTVLAAHEPRLERAVFHCSASRFGEAVWTGRATRHIRRALEGHLSLPQLDALWRLISPGTFVPRLRHRPVQHLIVSGRYDPVFLPYLTEALVGEYHAHGVPCSWRRMPCGHYTLGTFPFNALAVVETIRFLGRLKRDRAAAPPRAEPYAALGSSARNSR